MRDSFEPARHLFTMVEREEVWTVPGFGRPPLLVARRAGQGWALTTASRGGLHIAATDDPSLLAHGSAGSIAAAREAFERVLANQFETVPFAAARFDARSPIRLRLRGTASTVSRDSLETTRTFLSITASTPRRGTTVSVVTSPDFMTEDIHRLFASGADRPAIRVEDPRLYPIVWCAGSGAVLMHEVVGHAAEHAALPIVWPSWLRVDDVPDIDGGYPMAEVDDTGVGAVTADLTAGQRPSARRRASFTDMPISRMTNVVVRQRDAPWPEPLPRIEVSLVGGGRYDPLTDRVTIRVTEADLISATGRQALEPFELDEARKTIAARLAGASGEPRRYPGVICSSEGQELVVGSFCPDVVTSAMLS
jgi:hypothetical protein